MGGGDNSAPPSDVAPGGGTFPTDAFGTAYNPDWNAGGGAGGGIAKAFQQFGAGISAGSQAPNFITQAQFAAPYIPNSESAMNPALIPTPQGGAQTDLLEALRRLLSSGGLG